MVSRKHAPFESLESFEIQTTKKSLTLKWNIQTKTIIPEVITGEKSDIFYQCLKGIVSSRFNRRWESSFYSLQTQHTVISGDWISSTR